MAASHVSENLASYPGAMGGEGCCAQGAMGSDRAFWDFLRFRTISPFARRFLSPRVCTLTNILRHLGTKQSKNQASNIEWNNFTARDRNKTKPLVLTYFNAY